MAASTNLTPEQRKQRAKLAAHVRWSKEDDPKASGERGQRGLRDKFLREVAEEFPGLNAAEVGRRAENRYQAHMIRLAFLSSKARKGGDRDAA